MSPALSQVLEQIRRAELPSFDGVALDGPDVRSRNFGETPLHIVAIWGDVDAARVLIEEGATIDVPAEHDCTALHEAALQGHVEVVKLLLDKGANPTLQSGMGNFFEIAALVGGPELKELAERLRPS